MRKNVNALVEWVTYFWFPHFKTKGPEKGPPPRGEPSDDNQSEAVITAAPAGPSGPQGPPGNPGDFDRANLPDPDADSFSDPDYKVSNSDSSSNEYDSGKVLTES